ncbi:DUF4097 family beta strand repeat-containing protein [Blastococcus sp. CT_GayMR16]|uniref:DUF4097 family beta strand repeat-containing protein n=1 Tax=Blastococcus sp. CT_GayMR16 TaxID=2559607 RepID=UPI00107314F8|nr:DUF4097 family beta strand repeat-containing protein [Blastococcus sp. CT_GayMR16]TFV89937.1 hypothetical protein E4P38_05665 [Blastococcus sp. CT_GayMR16]
MPTFDTPFPVQIRTDVSGGSLRVRAADRSDTVVTVRPSNERSSADAQAADQTRVEYADGKLVVTSPRRPRLLFFGNMPSVDIEVLVPEASSLEAVLSAGDVDCEGRLGDVRIDNRYGDIRIDRAATLHARTSAGDITVVQVDGDGEASTSYGEIRVRTAGGDLRLDSACGDITVERALASVGATTKYGQVSVHQAAAGSLDLATAYGKVEAGITEGTPAWLDLESSSGKVRNQLTPSDAPSESDEPLRIRARTSYGDIVVRRA